MMRGLMPLDVGLTYYGQTYIYQGFSLSVFVSLCISVCLSVSVSLSLYVSLCLSVSVSLLTSGESQLVALCTSPAARNSAVVISAFSVDYVYYVIIGFCFCGFVCLFLSSSYIA